MSENNIGAVNDNPPDLDERVLVLADTFSRSGNDSDSATLSALYALLAESKGGLTPNLAVRIVFSNGLAFIPRICEFISRRVELDQCESLQKELVQSVYLLMRLVLVLQDKERELHKVGDLLFKNGMMPCFDAMLTGWMDGLELPGESEEGELRAWVMRIVTTCYHFDKMMQLGKVEELYEVQDELFKEGFYGKVVQIFGAGPISQTTEVAAHLLQGVSDCPRTKFREKLRKSGVIMLASARLTSMPTFRMAAILLYNMSRSLSTHNSLREADLLATATNLVPEYRTGSVGADGGAEHDAVVQLAITLAVANVYGTAEDDMQEAHTFLAQQHVAEQVVQMIRNALEGLDGIPEVLQWHVSLEESVFMSLCLSQHGWLNDDLVSAGIIEVLKQVLEKGDEASLPGARTLLNLCYSPHICAKIQEADLTSALNNLRSSSDLRVSDAVTGCLARLGALVDDKKATSSWKGRSISDMLSMIASQGTETQEGQGQQKERFNVFLSHRRSDSKDFARALFNLLTQRGYTTYLDFEYLRDLGDLRDSVKRSDNLIFILSDTIFDSYWCKQELMTAIEAGANIILIVKEGAKWRNKDGQEVYDFPPQHYIAELPEAAQKVFNSNVAIKHSDEYYQSFVEKVLSRLLIPEASSVVSDATSSPAAVMPNDGTSQQQGRVGNEVNVDSSSVYFQGGRPVLAQGGQDFSSHQISSAAILAADKLQASFNAMCSSMEEKIRTSNSSEMQHLRHEVSKELATMHREITAEISQTKREFSADVSEMKRLMTSEIGTLRASLKEMTSLLHTTLMAQKEITAARSATTYRPPPGGENSGSGSTNDYGGVKLIDQHAGVFRLMNTPPASQDGIDIPQAHVPVPPQDGRVHLEAISGSSRHSQANAVQPHVSGLDSEASFSTGIGSGHSAASGHQRHQDTSIPPSLFPTSRDRKYVPIVNATMMAPDTVLHGNIGVRQRGIANEKQHGNGIFPALMVDSKKLRNK